MTTNKSSNIQEPFDHRWVYVIFGIVIMLCLGTVYSWSIFRVSLEKHYNIGSTESALPYMVSFCLLLGNLPLHPRDNLIQKNFIIRKGRIKLYNKQDLCSSRIIFPVPQFKLQKFWPEFVN